MEECGFVRGEGRFGESVDCCMHLQALRDDTHCCGSDSD